MNTLKIFASFLILLPTITGIWTYKQLRQEFKILTFYLVIFSVLEMILHILSIQKINNLFLMHTFLPIQAFLLIYIFHLHFCSKHIIYLGFGFVVMSITNSLFIQPIHTYNTYALYLCSILMIFFSLYYFYKVFTELKIEKLLDEGMLWFSTGLLFYHSGTMIIYLSSNYLIKFAPDSFALIYKLVQVICLTPMYLLFTLAIWKGKKT